jgi:hypothetical protein
VHPHEVSGGLGLEPIPKRSFGHQGVDERTGSSQALLLTELPQVAKGAIPTAGRPPHDLPNGRIAPPQFDHHRDGQIAVGLSQYSLEGLAFGHQNRQIVTRQATSRTRASTACSLPTALRGR